MLLIHKPLLVPEVVAHLDDVMSDITCAKISQISHADFEKAWRNWLSGSSYNHTPGLELFPQCAFCPGTTDAFGEFIARHPDRRIRVSKSDFVLTKILCRTWNRNIRWLEDDDLSSDDCLIISMPFSGNGGMIPNQDSILDQADRLAVPVFVDGAYFGISHGVNYPLHRECVTDFTTSLSKNLVGNDFRLGVRFTKQPFDDGIASPLIGNDIFDRLNSLISISLLQKFPHDWFVEKYLPLSRKICQQHGIIETNTVTLALGTEDMQQFKRGDYVRICITDEIIGISATQ